MEINGLPLHPLIVHAAVVLTPLAGLLAVLVAVVPRWRWVLRWPLVASAVVGAVVTYVSALSGSDLKDQLGIRGSLIENHEMWAGRLQLAMWVLAGTALVAAYVLPFPNPLAARSDRAARVGVLRIPAVAVLVVVGLLTVFLVYKTGDAGARMVWNGRG